MTIKVWVKTYMQGSKVCDEIEIDDDEIDGLSDDDTTSYIDEIVRAWALEKIEWGWDIEHKDGE